MRQQGRTEKDTCRDYVLPNLTASGWRHAETRIHLSLRPCSNQRAIVDVALAEFGAEFGDGHVELAHQPAGSGGSSATSSPMR
jgi:hypothetical protein